MDREEKVMELSDLLAYFRGYTLPKSVTNPYPERTQNHVHFELGKKDKESGRVY